MVEAPLIGRDDELARARTVLEPDGPAVVVVRGPAGIGKSRLLAEVAAEAATTRPVTRIFGSRAVRPVPFGAVSHLLDLDVLPADPTTLFAHLRRELAGAADPHRPLLVVDDAHELDDATIGVVQQIAAHGDGRVLLAVRVPADAAEVLGSLIGRPDAVRIDLGSLDRTQTDRLVAHLLESPVPRDLSDWVWSRTLGSPLFVAVLVGALDGAVGAADRRHLTVASLHDLVRTRMAVLSADARRAVEVSAIGGHLPAAIIEAIAGPDGTKEAVSSGFLEVDRDRHLGIAHPLYAEAVLDAMSGPDRLRIGQNLVDSLPEGVPSDRIRRAILFLDAGRRLAAGEAAAAAMDAVARLDHLLGERLARAALADDPTSVAARLALSRALELQGRGEEALEALEGAVAVTIEDRVEVAIARGHALAFLLGRAEDAVELLRSEAADLPAEARAPLDADRSLYGAMRGSFSDAIEAGERVLANRGATELSKVRAATNLILARTMVGSLDGLATVIDEAVDLAARHRETRPFAAMQCDLTIASWHHLSGRVREAFDFTNERASAGAEDLNPVWAEWWGVMADAVGRFAEAIASQRRAIDGYARMDPFRLRPQAAGMLALSCGQIAAIPDDLSALLAATEQEAAGEARLTVWVGRGKAWIEAVRTGPSAAAEVALAAGRDAAEQDHLAWAALAFHDAVRFGAPSLVRRDLEEAVASMSGAHLLETMSRHAAALDDGDGHGLAEVANRFEEFGAVPLAVEAWCQAATLKDQQGDPAAGLAATRAALLARTTPGLDTPAWQAAPEILSARELDVVAGAVAGGTSREIGEELYLSVRTVDNHLASVYRKLAVGGREELSARLAAP